MLWNNFLRDFQNALGCRFWVVSFPKDFSFLFPISQKKGWILSCLGQLLPSCHLSNKVPQPVSRVICRVSLFLGSSSSEELEQAAGYPSTQRHFPHWEAVTSCKAEKEMKGARWLTSNLQLPFSSPQSSPLSSIVPSTFLWFYPWFKKVHYKKNGSDSFVSMSTALGPPLRVGPDPHASVAFSVTTHRPPAGS